MSLDESLFVSPTIHERTVKLADEKEHTLHFRELSGVEFRMAQELEKSNDEATRASAMQKMISLSLVNPDGTPALDFDKAKRLKANVVLRLFNEIMEVNGYTGKKHSAGAEQSGSATP